MTIEFVDLEEGKRLIEQGALIIDVREATEYDANHIEGAINYPISSFNPEQIIKQHKDCDKIIIHCLKGSRAENACFKVEYLDKTLNLFLMKCGIEGWKDANYRLVNKLENEDGDNELIVVKEGLDLNRQVQIIAGLSVLITVILGFVINGNFFYVTGFVGIGLIFAGISGFCAVAKILAKMPWNK